MAVIAASAVLAADLGDVIDGPEIVLAQFAVAAGPAHQFAGDVLHAVPQRALQRAAELSLDLDQHFVVHGWMPVSCCGRPGGRTRSAGNGDSAVSLPAKKRCRTAVARALLRRPGSRSMSGPPAQSSQTETFPRERLMKNHKLRFSLPKPSSVESSE